MKEDKTAQQNISLVVDTQHVDGEAAERIQRIWEIHRPERQQADEPCGLTLKLDANGLALLSDGQMLKGDFNAMVSRLNRNNLGQELLVRAAKIKHGADWLTAIDATAGLGEDSFLLAAAGFHVTLYERNWVMYELLRDALKRAAQQTELADIVQRMRLVQDDSVQAMQQLQTPPDVILLDPMFPARQKSALVKKKLQIIQKLELPCMDERELLLAAMTANPKKVVIKRPVKGPYLAGIKPDYALSGKAVRFDCMIGPYDRFAKKLAIQ